MRCLACLFLLVPAAAYGQAPAAPAWQPAADYITVGQDEPGYRNWFSASPAHGVAVRAFNAYLATYRVAGIVPTWQLLRTATSWQRCGGAPFEVPPVGEWPNIVQTLRYVNDYVVPAVGPVEPVSAYRNPALNVCAGGAAESAHKHYSAIDLVPLRPTSREELMRTLCRAHARRGDDYQVGLGFYAFLRFHVDTTRFRRWGTDDGAAAACPTLVRPTDVASAAPPPIAAAPASPMPLSGPPAGTSGASSKITAPRPTH